MSSITSLLVTLADYILDKLNFNGCTNPVFREDGIGKIGTTGFVLGLIGGVHIGIFAMASLFARFSGSDIPMLSALWTWGAYMSLLCTFHFLEFFVTAARQPSKLSFNSYLVNHGRSYTLAAVASWLEFWVEYYFLGRMKLFSWITWIGIVLVVGGQLCRSVAMWTCAENFSHIVADEKEDDHVLVTDGIYRYLRHPSYFGWFYWSVGTQMILCNPICTVCYAAASWYFFASRIPYEEHTLTEFFGEEYVAYCKRTYIGIPYITDNIALRANLKHDKDD